jgi:hypothetical protein
MTVTLAATWNPRGELNRFRKYLPEILELYDWLVVVLPPPGSGVENQEERSRLAGWLSADGSHDGRVKVTTSQDWGMGRYLALQHGVETGADFIQYADFDRLLRWIETRPQELRATVAAIQDAGCTVIGRTPAAYATHPRALVETERLSNMVVSHILGEPMDVSAGSKGFSREAAAFIVANGATGRSLGKDAEWPIMAQRAGFSLAYLEVDGLDWESADRYRDQAATSEGQRRAAVDYDADPQHWDQRVDVAREIIETALEAVRVDVPDRGELSGG